MADLYFNDGGQLMTAWVSVDTGKVPGPNGHRFGGPARHRGAVPQEQEHPLHLTYEFDSTESDFPIKFANFRWMPLYFPFQFEASHLWYRVLSDDAIEIVRQDSTNWTEEFPYANYPAEFPYCSASVNSPVDIRWEIEDIYGEPADDTCDEHDLVALCANFCQGPPRTNCVSPACNNQVMDVFARLRWNEHDDVPFGDGEWEYTKVYFDICPKCHLIHAGVDCS